MGWEVGGKFRREGTYVYLWLIHVDVWQKPTQYCKAIILQLKINFKSLVLTWDLAYAKLNLGPIVLFLTHINELNPAIIQRFIM